MEDDEPRPDERERGEIKTEMVEEIQMREDVDEMEEEKQSTKLNRRNNDQKWKWITNTEVEEEKQCFKKRECPKMKEVNQRPEMK